jgi:hypothetical protein
VSTDERDPTRPFDRLLDLLRVMSRAKPVGDPRRRATSAGRAGRPTAYLLLTTVAGAEERRAALPWVRRGGDDTAR